MHWTRRVGLLCLGLLSLGLVRTGQGQDNIAVNDGGVVYLDDFSGSAFLSRDGGNYLLFHKVVGEGVGHEVGYSRLGVRTRLWEGFEEHLFGELHAMITDDARVGYNIGGGFRRQAGGGIMGFHAWFDDYESARENRYRQITTGLEYLHPTFDIRANGYIPISDQENYIGIVNQGTDVSFMGNHLVTAGTVSYERAFYGWDLEGGGPVPLAENWLRAYGGIYQLLYEDDMTTGFRARAEARFMQGVNLNLIVSDDEKYGTNVNLGVEVRFRGTMPTRFESGYLADRRYDQVRRVWPVQTHVDVVNDSIVLNNPGTDDPINIIFVDNTNTGGGTGTFEDPFTALPDGDADADLFLVNTGSGSTFGNITLLDGQQLLGAGKPHFVETDRLGVIQLPEEFNQVSGNFPILEAADMGLPIITLANDNVVSGFNLRGVDGIAGGDVNNFLIECIHSDSITNGISIANATGTGILRDITFEPMAGGNGILVSNSTTGSTLDLLVEDVAIDGGSIGVGIQANGGDVNYAIDGLTVENTTTAGLGLVGNSAALNGTVLNTVVDDNDGSGVVIMLDDTTGRTTLDAIQASGNGVDGIRVVAANGSDYIVDVLNSTIDSNIDDNIDTDSVDAGSILTVNVDPTTLINAGDNAFEFMVEDGATLNANFLDVTMTGATNDGINGNILNGGIANLDFANFDASGAGDDGMDITLDGGSALTGTFTNTDLPTSGSFSDAASSSINIEANNGSVAILDFTDITADNMSADGNVNLIANADSQIQSTWTGGSISNGLATGVTLDGDGAGTQIAAIFNDVVITNNAGDGINAELTGGDADSILNVILNNVDLSANMADGLDYAIDGTDAMGTIVFNNADLSFNLEDAFQFDVTGGAIMMASTTDLTTNDFSNSGSNAFQGNVDGAGSTAVVEINDAPANNSGEEGALLTNNNGGSLGFYYTNGTLSQSGFDGLSSTTDNGSLTEILLDTVSLDGNGFGMGATSGDGLVASVDNASTLTLMLNDVSTNSNLEKGVSLTAANGSTVNSSSNTGTFVSTSNGEEGLYFDVQSGSTLSFNSVLGTTSGNGLNGSFSGVRGVVDGTDSAATVSFDNFTSNFNSLDGFEFDVTGGGMLISELLSTPSTTGQLSSASTNFGSGITLDVTGAGSVGALIMEGDNIISNNFENGLVVNATDAEQLAVQAVGSFNSNFTGYGIQINSTNVTNTAIEIGDGTLASVSNNGLGGIEINLDNTTVDDIAVTTLTQMEIVESLAIDGMTVENNQGGSGILISATDTTLNDGSITEVDANFNAGDGIGLFFDNSTVNGLTVEDNGAQMNLNNGINLDLSNMTVADGVNINNNTGAPQNLGIDFLIDGNILAAPFAITNTSDPGLSIANLIWDLSTIGSGPVFNTAGAGSQSFTPQNFSEFFTGLNTLNGVNVPPYNAAVPDNSQFLSMNFSDFDPGETMEFSIGVAPSQFFQSTILGSDLINSLVVVDFANGAQLTGTMDSVVGNTDASMFNATSQSQVETGLLGNGEDGLRIHVDNSTLSNSNVTGNIANDNGSNGIEVLVENGSTIDLLNISDTVANNNVDEGILFTLNDSTATSITIDSAMVDDADGPNGIAFYSDNSTAESITISNSVVQNSPNEGILVLGTNSALDNVILDGNSVLDSLGDGVRIDLTDTAVAGTLAINNGSIVNSGGNGLTLNLDNSPVGRLEMSGNNAGTAFAGGTIDVDFTNLIWTTSIDNNNSAGLDIASFQISLLGTNRVWRSDQTPFNNRFQVTGNSGVLTGLAQVNGVTVNPATDPLQNPNNNNMVLAEGGVATGSRVVTFDFNDFNPGESFNYSLAHSAQGQSITGDLTGATGTVTLVDGRTASAVAQNSFGFNIFQTFAQTFGGISSNAGSGVVLNATNGSNIGEIFIDDNLLQENGQNGIEFNIADSTLPAVGNESVISNTSIGLSGGDAFVMTDPDTNGTDFQLDFVDNTITENNGNAINISLNADSGAMTSTMSGNTISDNVGFGIRIDARETSGLDLAVGDSTGNANTISGNQNAGVAISLVDDVTAAISVQNTVVSNTVLGTDGDYSGQGLDIRTQDDVVLTNLTIGDPALMNTSFTGNVGNGIEILADASAMLIDPTIQNVTSSGNGGDGVQIRRLGDANISTFTISGSTFSNNADGIDIRARHADTNDIYVIEENTISMNNGRGLSVLTEGDAQVELDVLFNTITLNGTDGIQTTASENALTDVEAFTGNILGNLIADNGDDGIDINSVYGFIDGASTPLNIGMLGVDGMGRSLGNEIRGNGSNGIEIGSTFGFVNIVNNEIAENENSGIEVATPNVVHNLLIQENDILDNGMHGIDLINNAGAIPTFFGRTINAVIDNNTIRGNERDGIQILASGGRIESTGSVINDNATVNVDIINGNDVSFNGGRGIDILVRGRGNANINIDDATVERNGEEGIYSVITTSETQSNEVSATTALAQDGRVFSRPTLDINVSNSTIGSNSSPGGYEGAGLVFRVGTSGANTHPGGNVDSWREPNTTDPAARGGLIATIDNNVIRDNFGIDFFMHTFSSTSTPITTTGSWTDQNENPRDNTNDVFDIDTYEQDPLARIRIDSFTGNTGGTVDVLGATNGTGSSQNFAFYNNAEDVFKSRTTGQDNATDAGLDDDGPFSTATRIRNATRLPARTTFVNGVTLNPDLTIPGTGGTPGDSDDYLYPGVGESTLQISLGSDLDLSTMFDTVITDFTDQIGVSNGNNGLNYGGNAFDTSYVWEVF